MPSPAGRPRVPGRPAPAQPQRAPGTAARSRGLRHAFDSTPGRLRLASLVVLGLSIVAGIAGGIVISQRGKATRDVGLRSEPLLFATQDIFSSLASADATAANAFLAGGAEPADQRATYVAAISRATASLNQAISLAPSGRAADALTTIGQDLPTYTGLVEAARAGNRQGLPIGAAYLRQASNLMQETILPATDDLYRAAADGLRGDYAGASQPAHVVVFAVFGLILLAALLATGRFLFQRTNRIINLPLALATFAALVAVVLVLGSFVAERGDLAKAKRRGSDQVQLLAQARILALRAKGAESLSLVARGNGQAYDQAFTTYIGDLQGTPESQGVLDRAKAGAGAGDTFFSDVSSGLSDYLDAHTQVAKLTGAGQYEQAATLALSSKPTDGNASFARLDVALRTGLSVDQARFVSSAKSARQLLGLLFPILVALLVIVCALTFIGLQQRINEYQ